MDALYAGRKKFSTADWKSFLLRSVGLEPTAMTERNRDVMLLRMIPFVENNYNLVELGPRGTGKSHLYQQISPYAHFVSGGKATVARMFVNNANGQRGLVCLFDVVCFDEVSGVSFDQKDGVNIMKGYMESGEFSRGKEIHPGLWVHRHGGQLRGGCAAPAADWPPIRPDAPGDAERHRPDGPHSLLLARLGRAEDQRRDQDEPLRLGVGLHQRMLDPAPVPQQGFGTARAADLRRCLSGRDQNAAVKTINGLLKLMHPSPDEPVPDEDLEWAVRLALECRRRVKEQQKRIGSAEFRNTQFSYTLGKDGVEKFVVTPELQSEDHIGRDPLPPGQVWTISPAIRTKAPGFTGSRSRKGRGAV